MHTHTYIHAYTHINMYTYAYTHSSCDQSSTTHDQFYLLKEWLMIATSLEFYDSFFKRKNNVYD